MTIARAMRRALLLAARQRDAALADHRVVALREVGDVLVEPRDRRRLLDAPPTLRRRPPPASPAPPAPLPHLPHLPSCRTRIEPERDVVGERVREQERLLRHEADRPAQHGRAGSSRTSTPSTNTVPGGGSCSRASRLISVDLPEPVTPTSATVCPASMRAETWSRTGVPL